MSEYNERRLLRRLQAISRIEPRPELTERAVRNAAATVERLSRSTLFRTPRPALQYLSVAAAAVLIVALIAGSAMVWHRHSAMQARPETIAKEETIPPNPLDASPELKDIESAGKPSPEMEREIKQILALAEASDMEGLLGVLTKGSFAGKLVAASYLMSIGDERAIAPLEELSRQWYSAHESNPFGVAVSHIRRRLAQDEAARIAPDPPSDTGSDPNTAKPAAITAAGTENTADVFKEIVQVHCVRQEQRFDGTMIKSETWIRLPDRLREDDPEAGRAIIDNGTQRLTLNTSAKEAQFSGTHKDVEPLRNHWLFEQLEALRGRKAEDFELTKIEDQSTEKTLVYSVETDDAKGRVWVEAAGMLPMKAEARWTGDPNSQTAQSATITFDYGPIPNEVFELRIPDGYTELSPKEAGAFSGHVVDLSGNPVAGAIVSVRAAGLPEGKPLTQTSDEHGVFNVKMPVNLIALHSPVVIWATLPERADLVGWTLLRSELDVERHASLGGDVPGYPGVVHVSPDYKITRTPEGTTWTAGWCMGASNMILVMEQAGRIVGKVTDNSGAGVAGAAIDVQFALEKEAGGHIYSYNNFWSTEASTDKEGKYQVGYLPRLWRHCIWLVRVAAEGFVSESKTCKSDGPLGVIAVDFKLNRAAVTVRGTLKDNYGTPLSNRAIFAAVDNKRYYTCHTRSDANGRFELKGCPDAPGLGVFVELSYNSFQAGTPERDLFVHYPDLTADAGYEPGRDEYEIELIAALPELTIEVAVVDSEGHPLPYYPVEIRADEHISTQWKLDQGFYAITNEAGFCRLNKVPDLPGLKVVLSGQYYTSSYQHLPQPQRETIEEFMKIYRNKYKWTEAPVDLVRGRKEYYVRATLLEN